MRTAPPPRDPTSPGRPSHRGLKPLRHARTRSTALTEPWWLLLAVACVPKALPDPLAAQRAAWASHALAEDWPAQAALVLDETLIERALHEELAGALAAGAAPLEMGLFGVRASLGTAAEVGSVEVAPVADCATCLSVAVALSGRHTLKLSNPTGRFEHEIPWTGVLTGALSLSVDRGRQLLLAAPAAPEAWGLELTLSALPPGWSAPWGQALQDQLRGQVRRSEEAVLVLTRLPDEMGQLLDLRVRAAPAGLVLDMAVTAGEAGVVGDLPTPPADGWVVTLPAATALAMARDALFAVPYDPEAATSVEVLDLSFTPGRFDTVVRLWPHRRKAAARDLRITGPVALNPDGDVLLQGQDVVLLDGDGDAQGGLEGFLFDRFYAPKLKDAVRMVMPGRIDSVVVGVAASARVTGVEAAPGGLLLTGELLR